MILALTLAAAQALELPEQALEIPALNAQLFRPALASPHFLWTDESGLSTASGLSARAAMSWSSQPLVYHPLDGQPVRVLDDVIQADIAGAWRVGRLLLGVDVPAVVQATSDLSAPQAGLGDVAGELRWTALRRDLAPIGLALGARGCFPTATLAAPLASPSTSAEGQVVVDGQIGALLLAINLGYRLFPAREEGSPRDPLLARAGAAWIASEAAGLSLDFAASPVWSELDEAARPAELMGGGWLALGQTVVLRAGLGTGLGAGPGAPRLRAVLALDLRPASGTGSGTDSAPPTSPAPPITQLAVTPAGPAAPPPSLIPAELSVRVMNRDGAAVAATVQLIDPDTATALPGPSPFVVAPGIYTLFVDAPGYAPTRQELQLNAEERRVVDVVLGERSGP